MANKFCGNCGKPLLEKPKVEIKPTWRLAWGLEWRRWLLILALCVPLVILFYAVYLVFGITGISG